MVFKFLGRFYYVPLITVILIFGSLVFSELPPNVVFFCVVLLRIGLGATPGCIEGGIKNPPICIAPVSTAIVGGAPGTPELKSWAA